MSPSHLKQLLRTHKSATILALLCFLGVLAVVVSIPVVLAWRSLSFDAPAAPDSIPEPVAVPVEVFHHPLTGAVRSTPWNDPIPYVFGVMIDESRDAWPPSGIDQAFAVFEAPVEGNIPRMFALFSEESKVAKIGPVRSARPYFVEWSEIFSALYVHVGGSPEALGLIRSHTVPDLDEFFAGRSFWRAKDRFAPHNAYTSSDLARTAIASRKDVARLAKSPWTFIDELKKEDRSCDVETVRIPFSTNGVYAPLWKLDQQTGEFVRHQDGSLFLTETKALVKAKNLLILEAPVAIIDEVGRKRIPTLTSGEFRLFQEGCLTTGTYRRTKLDQPIELTNATGNIVPQLPGVIWISVLPDLDAVGLTRHVP